MLKLATDLPAAGHFRGREQFQQLVREAMACAARQGWPQLIFSDANFEDWPLGEKGVAESLQNWAAAGRHLILLAQNYDEIIRRHARFVSWRKTWSHIVEARICASVSQSDLPSAILGPCWMLQRLNLVHCTGISSAQASRRLLLGENLQEWLKKSTPAFPAYVLGL